MSRLSSLSRSFWLALAAATLSTAPAVAAPAKDRSVEVRYDDLDLSSPAGRSKLEKRIRNAAQGLCSFRGLPPAREVEKTSACMKQTVARTMQRIELAAADQRAAEGMGDAGGAAQLIEVSR